MKKYSLIFVLSFISYALLFIARPFITAQVWADCILVMFIASVLYQSAYIFYLRKFENIGLGKAVVLFFLYFFILSIVGTLIYHICIFFNGTDVSLFGTGRVYGFSALELDLTAGLVYRPISLIGIIYLITFFVIWKFKKR